MKLYYSKGACSLAVRIIIHELNLSCQFESVDIKAKKTESGQDFMEINPKGSVAAFELPNHEILTENVAIMQYLADNHNASHLLPATKDLKRYRILEWLNYLTTEIHKGFSPLFSSVLAEEIKQSFFTPLLEKKLVLLENHLAHKTYIMDKDFTLPDAYLFVMLRWLTPVAKISFDKYPHLKKYFENLKTRSSIQKSLKEEGLD